jgi:RNA polymerase primary sigma factor
LGLKRERVRDIRKKAERKMKKYTKNDQLKSYLK